MKSLLHLIIFFYSAVVVQRFFFLFNIFHALLTRYKSKYYSKGSWIPSKKLRLYFLRIYVFIFKSNFIIAFNIEADHSVAAAGSLNLASALGHCVIGCFLNTLLIILLPFRFFLKLKRKVKFLHCYLVLNNGCPSLFMFGVCKCECIEMFPTSLIAVVVHDCGIVNFSGKNKLSPLLCEMQGKKKQYWHCNKN